MPRATIDITDVEEHDLKTLAGGQVTLRRLSFGEWLERQTLAMDLSMVGTPGQAETMEMKMAVTNQKVTEFEFRKCVVKHNLEDDSGNMLDFQRHAGAVILMLDPKVGQEIAQLISDMNNVEASLGNSAT